MENSEVLNNQNGQNLLWVQKCSLLLCQPILKLWQMPYSPQHPDVGLKYGHHDVIIQPYIRHHSPHRLFKLHRLI